MKVRSSFKSAKRCRKCKMIKRGQNNYIICENPKHKAKQA